MPIFLHFCFNLCFGSVSPMTDVKTEDTPWILCHFHPTTAVATTPLRPLYTSNLNLSPHSVHESAGPSIFTVTSYFQFTLNCTLYNYYSNMIPCYHNIFLEDVISYISKIVFYKTNYFIFCCLWNMPPKARLHIVYASIQPCGLQCSLARQRTRQALNITIIKRNIQCKNFFDLSILYHVS